MNSENLDAEDADQDHDYDDIDKEHYVEGAGDA